MWKSLPLLGLLSALPGCAELDLDLTNSPEQPMSPPPSVAPMPAVEVSAPLSLGPSAEMIVHPPVALPSGTPMSVKEAERLAVRFRTLHQLAVAGLVDRDRYRHWARDNQGAFLLLTAPPPMVGLAATTPRFDELADFLRNLKNERDEIAEAERRALLDSLMPLTALRAKPRSLPTDPDGLRDWMTFLDQIDREEFLPIDAIAAEKAALALVVSQ